MVMASRTVDPDGGCKRHPFLQLQRRSALTGEWVTLLDSCPICLVEGEDTESDDDVCDREEKKDEGGGGIESPRSLSPSPSLTHTDDPAGEPFDSSFGSDPRGASARSGEQFNSSFGSDPRGSSIEGSLGSYGPGPQRRGGRDRSRSRTRRRTQSASPATSSMARYSTPLRSREEIESMLRGWVQEAQDGEDEGDREVPSRDGEDDDDGDEGDDVFQISFNYDEGDSDDSDDYEAAPKLEDNRNIALKRWHSSDGVCNRGKLASEPRLHCNDNDDVDDDDDSEIPLKYGEPRFNDDDDGDCHVPLKYVDVQIDMPSVGTNANRDSKGRSVRQRPRKKKLFAGWKAFLTAGRLAGRSNSIPTRAEGDDGGSPGSDVAPRGRGSPRQDAPRTSRGGRRGRGRPARSSSMPTLDNRYASEAPFDVHINESKSKKKKRTKKEKKKRDAEGVGGSPRQDPVPRSRGRASTRRLTRNRL